MNLDFNGTQPVLVYKPHSQFIVTLALILTFSPGEKGQRLQASLYAVGRRANPVAGAWWFRGSRRELLRGILSPFGGERESDKLRRYRNGPDLANIISPVIFEPE
jgi:hypothetical protein